MAEISKVATNHTVQMVPVVPSVVDVRLLIVKSWVGHEKGISVT